MRVFISGPVTGYPDYKDRFNNAELKLAETGYKVINPAKILDFDMAEGIDPDHISKYQENMNNCYELIDECDAIYHMKGWIGSHGCQQEHRYGILKGKIFMYEEDMWHEQRYN